ncbi:MAG: hypothetical protein NPIRA02_29630 [Nitrospirales bacterium]|nr:MAG: hypothetical protein NPIRA02_29630 [Nitrospirales bacterium]
MSRVFSYVLTFLSSLVLAAPLIAQTLIDPPLLQWDAVTEWGDGSPHSYEVFVDGVSMGTVPHDEDVFEVPAQADGEYIATVRARSMLNGELLSSVDSNAVSYTIQSEVGHPGNVSKYNFQPNMYPVPDGYIKANGGPYVPSIGHGWDRSVDERLRTGSNDDVDRTLIGYKGTSMATWRLDLPNGAYAVTIGLIDPQFNQGRQRIAMEGVTVIDLPSLSANTRHELRGRVVMIDDGSLEIQLIPEDGRHVIVNYVHVESVDGPVMLPIPNNYTIEE